MTKRRKPAGRSVMRGNSPAPYTKRRKAHYPYPWQHRLSNGELQSPANQSVGNKYR